MTHLSVLDKRFPKDASREPSPVFDALIRGAIKGGWDPKFLEDEMKRAAEQATVAAMVGEERFIQPLPPVSVSPAALPPPVVPMVPYPALAPAELETEFATGPHTAVIDAVPDGPTVKTGVAVKTRAPAKRKSAPRRPALRGSR